MLKLLYTISKSSYTFLLILLMILIFRTCILYLSLIIINSWQIFLINCEKYLVFLMSITNKKRKIFQIRVYYPLNWLVFVLVNFGGSHYNFASHNYLFCKIPEFFFSFRRPDTGPFTEIFLPWLSLLANADFANVIAWK